VIDIEMKDVDVLELIVFGRELLEHEYRFLKEGINYLVKLDYLKVSFMFRDLKFIVTEGERGVLYYGILSTEEGGVSYLGLGYVILKTNNNHMVQEGGIC
jgi:hypothetical protein